MQFLIARSTVPAATQLPTRVRWIVRGNGGSGFGRRSTSATTRRRRRVMRRRRAAMARLPTACFVRTRRNTSPRPGPGDDPVRCRCESPAATGSAPGSADRRGRSGEYLVLRVRQRRRSRYQPELRRHQRGGAACSAIAALVLQSRGGAALGHAGPAAPILQQSTFAHDLDPMLATGTAASSDGGTVTLTIRSDEESNKRTGGNDPNRSR